LIGSDAHTLPTLVFVMASASSQRRRGGSHKGNNGLLGRPSNNKGIKRTVFVPRSTEVDMEVLQRLPPGVSDDTKEDLLFEPITAYMLRSPWVEHLVNKMMRRSQTIVECKEVLELLGHTTGESSCIVQVGNDADYKVSVVKGWRQNVFVAGDPYHIRPVKRSADRKIRGYHLYLASARAGVPRAQLALISRDPRAGSDAYTASHTCGGSCITHVTVERNSINQARKVCHRRMREAIKAGRCAEYRTLRGECQHQPACFINPKASDIDTDVITE
jgi:hypothetical protein